MKTAIYSLKMQPRSLLHGLTFSCVKDALAKEEAAADAECVKDEGGAGGEMVVAEEQRGSLRPLPRDERPLKCKGQCSTCMPFPYPLTHPCIVALSSSLLKLDC